MVVPQTSFLPGIFHSRDFFFCHLQKNKTPDFAEVGEGRYLAAQIGERDPIAS